MIRLLVVDDQELVRAGLRLMLSADEDLEIVGEASDGREGVEHAARLRPDVVLMDVGDLEPGPHGTPGARRTAKTRRDLPAPRSDRRATSPGGRS